MKDSFVLARRRESQWGGFKTVKTWLWDLLHPAGTSRELMFQTQLARFWYCSADPDFNLLRCLSGNLQG